MERKEKGRIYVRGNYREGGGLELGIKDGRENEK